MIALLCSVQAEAEWIAKQLSQPQAVTDGATTFTEGLIAGRKAVLSVGGMGKVNASHAATLLITRYHPGAIICFGIGGAYPSSRARIGDIAIAKSEITADEGVLTPDGFRDTEHIGIPLLRTPSAIIYTTFPAPERLYQRAYRVLTATAGGPVHTGAFITLSTCTGTDARARELEDRHHGLCENMEGAAVAHVAALHEVPWLEIRGVSNMVGDRDMKSWDIPRAASAVQKALLKIIEAWSE